jgi:hypothetical protein
MNDHDPEAAARRLRSVSAEVLDAAYRACVDNNLKGVAGELDDAFGEEAKRVTVTEDSLRACLKQKDRNKARLEWAPLLVTLPGSEVLAILARHAGCRLVKDEPITDAQFRAEVKRVLPQVFGTMGAEFLERLEGRVSK